MAKRKPKPFDQGAEVRKLARERVGTVPATQVIEPKSRRKKVKHKKPPGEDGGGAGA